MNNQSETAKKFYSDKKAVKMKKLQQNRCKADFHTKNGYFEHNDHDYAKIYLFCKKCRFYVAT